MKFAKIFQEVRKPSGNDCFLEIACLWYDSVRVNPMQPSDAFHIETSHFIYTANQMNGFCMNTTWEKNGLSIKHFTAFEWHGYTILYFMCFLIFRALNLDVDLSLVKTSFGILNHPLKYWFTQPVPNKCYT